MTEETHKKLELDFFYEIHNTAIKYEELGGFTISGILQSVGQAISGATHKGIEEMEEEIGMTRIKLPSLQKDAARRTGTKRPA
jgi:hypothetical protein